MKAETNLTSGKWLQRFIDDRESGLFIFETGIARAKEADVLEQFGDAFLAVKEKLGDGFVDEISFGEAFTKWQTVKKKKRTNGGRTTTGPVQPGMAFRSLRQGHILHWKRHVPCHAFLRLC